jgi:hypothetical protein
MLAVGFAHCLGTNATYNSLIDIENTTRLSIALRRLKLITKYSQEGEDLGIAGRSGIVGEAANTGCSTQTMASRERRMNGFHTAGVCKCKAKYSFSRRQISLIFLGRFCALKLSVLRSTHRDCTLRTKMDLRSTATYLSMKDMNAQRKATHHSEASLSFPKWMKQRPEGISGCFRGGGFPGAETLIC